jgi:hypothetical protein
MATRNKTISAVIKSEKDIQKGFSGWSFRRFGGVL